MTNINAIDDWSCVGQILGPHGTKGNLKIKSFCEVPTAIQSYCPLQVQNSCQKLNIKILKQNRGFLNVVSPDIKDRETASQLTGKLLYIKKIRLPKIPKDEYYHSDLISINVCDTQQNRIGVVIAVHDYGAGTILEIQILVEKKAFLVPFTKHCFPDINLEKKFITLSDNCKNNLIK